MTIRVRSPLGNIVTAPAGRKVRRLESIEGRRMGLLWSQHAATVKFWPVLEKVAAETLHPSEVHRLYKTSTWNVATAEEVAAFARKVDYVLVGVGA